MKKKSLGTVKAKKTFLKKKHIPFFFISLSLVLLLLISIGLFLRQSKEKITQCANSISCINDLSGTFDTKAKVGEFMGKIVPIKNTVVLTPFQKRFILGDSTVEKRMYIDLSTQTLYANEGDKTVFSFPVSTGKWGRTPTGTFHIWVKLRYTRMTGGNRAIGTYYDLPNVPYTMFFYNDKVAKSVGYSIHGAYWHDNFGYPMSHGCINMKTEDAEKIYNWADPPTVGYVTYPTKENPGTEVVIYGVAPLE